jgi:hypothetical protein
MGRVMARAGQLAIVALALACAGREAGVEEGARLLSDGDGDGIMTEEGCEGDGCFTLANPDPSCVYLEVVEDPAGVCIVCLDAAFAELYSDCGSLPPPLPPSGEVAPGAFSDLWCEPAAGPDDGSLCWTCVAPDGSRLAEGCAPISEPADGAFCTASVVDDLLCVWCCDVTGAVLLEACAAPPEPIVTACEVYYDDGNVACTRCVTADGWIASDECILYEEPQRPVE